MTMTPDELRDIAERLIELADSMDDKTTINIHDDCSRPTISWMCGNEEKFMQEYRDALRAYSASKA